VACFGECDQDPTWSERAPWGNSPTPFDREALAAALGKVTLSACKRIGGKAGTGIAEITLLPSGDVQHVVIDGPGFAGTPVGECIEKEFKSVRVPSFGGFPVTVARPFTLK
jgi:hypothetical protein